MNWSSYYSQKTVSILDYIVYSIRIVVHANHNQPPKPLCCGLDSTSIVRDYS